MESGYSRAPSRTAGACRSVSSPDSRTDQKRCFKCGESKPFESFSLDRSRKDGRHARCKTCRKAHYEADKDRVAAASRAHYLANKERHGELSRAHYRANREHRSAKMAEWYEANKDVVSASQKAWRSANLHKIAAKQARRRAAETKATPAWANQALISSFYELAREATQRTGIPHHVDHIVPLRGKIVCGLHVESNLQVLPGAENLSKSNRQWPDMP